MTQLCAVIRVHPGAPKKIEIVQVCSGVNGFGRGAERFCLSLAAELANSGNEVLLVVGVNQLDSVPLPPLVVRRFLVLVTSFSANYF